MKKIKGALLKYFIINIRANKTGIYDELLTDEEKEIVNQQIFDAIWYPFEYYRIAFTAVFKVEAKGDVKEIIKWGYEFGKQIVSQMYRRSKKKRTLRHAITSYQHLLRLWFNFGELNEEIVSDNEFNLKFVGDQPDFDLHYYIALGWLKAFFEGYLEKEISTKFTKKLWEGDGYTAINLTWKS